MAKVLLQEPKQLVLPANWQIIVADFETRDFTTMTTTLCGSDAATLFRRFNRKAKQRQAVALFWPAWAPPINMKFEAE
jgi:hypothetical protein